MSTTPTDPIRQLLEQGDLASAVAKINAQSIARAIADHDWHALVAQARALEPGALFAAMAWLRWEPANYPQVVAAWMADVERLGAIRHRPPAKDAATFHAVRTWQRYRAKHIYRTFLELYRQVKIDDRNIAVRWRENYNDVGVSGLTKTFERSPGKKLLVRDSSQSPQDLALQMVADTMGLSSHDGARTLVFGRYRKAR
jgi:hypothetical protein